MFFQLDDEQRDIQELARKFAQNEIAPHAEDWDERHHFPRKLLESMAEMGLAGLLVPDEYGGSALPALDGRVDLRAACAGGHVNRCLALGA